MKFQVPHPILMTNLAADQKWPSSHFHISYQSSKMSIILVKSALFALKLLSLKLNSKEIIQWEYELNVKVNFNTYFCKFWCFDSIKGSCNNQTRITHSCTWVHYWKWLILGNFQNNMWDNPNLFEKFRFYNQTIIILSICRCTWMYHWKPAY